MISAGTAICLQAFFVGYTEDGRRIVYYQHVLDETRMFAQINDEDVFEISSGAKVEKWFDCEKPYVYMRVVSEELTATARMSRHDQLELPRLLV